MAGDDDDAGAPSRRPFIAWPEDVRRAFRELTARQVELEMQHKELTRAHFELDRLRARYTDLFHAAPFGYCVLDAKDQVLHANATLEGILGVARDGLATKSILHYVDPLDRGAFALSRARLNATGAPQWIDARMLRGDTSVWVSMALIEARDGRNSDAREMGWGTGQITCRLAVVDATARKLREQAVATLDAERRQSGKMEAVERFADAVASELDEVFGIIAAQAELAASTPELPPLVRAMQARILDAARQGARATQRLAGAERVDAAPFERTDLNALVRRMEPKLRALAGQDVEVIVDLHAGCLDALVDPALVDEVLVRLVVNAREAMPTGGVIFIVTSAGRAPPGLQARQVHDEATDDAPTREGARLQVIDVGSGIAPDDVPRVFDPYFTTKPDAPRRGLGLAQVFHAVQRLGGSISVKSEVGRGSTFEVAFAPLAAADAEAPRAPRPPAPTEARGGTEGVLLVEPDDAVRAAACAALAEAGYAVVAAADGSAALEAWERARRVARLLVTDGELTSALTGHELAEQLREDTPDLRVLFTSDAAPRSGSSGGERPRSNVFRIRFMLPKPFAMDALLEMVRRCLDA